MQCPVAVDLVSLRQPVKRALVTAARIGARGVTFDARHGLRPDELSDSGLRELRRRLDDVDLRVAAVRFPTRRGLGDPDDLERRVDAARAAMRMTADLKAHVLSVDLGDVRAVVRGDAAPPSEAEQGGALHETGPPAALVEVLTDLGRLGQHTGVRISARTGAAPADDLARLIAVLPEEFLTVDLCPAALILAGQRPGEATERLGPHVAHVTVSDATRDLSAGRGIEVQLGRGSVDLPEILALLEERAYRGWLTVERRGSDDPVGELAQALEFVRCVMTGE